MPPPRHGPEPAPAQLDLFGGDALAPSPAPGSAQRPAPPARPSPRVAAVPPVPAPPPLTTAAEPVLVPAGAEATLLRHPLANRECRLGAHTVAYEFKRGQRRTVGLNVGPKGLSVRAPRWTPLAEVERFLLSKADWVLDKLQQAHERQRHAPAPQVWAAGARIAYLGRDLTLVCDPGHGFEGAGAAVQDDRLLVGLPSRADAEQWRSTVHAWLMRQALALFTQRLDHFAPLLGVRHTRLSLSNAGTRWGSARADGGIRLHWRLVQLPPDLIDYVVVHELSHLREMNHSPAFWRVVHSVLPDQDARRRELRRVRLPSD